MKNKIFFSYFSVFSIIILIDFSSPLPIAILHGFMQSCSHEDLINMEDFIAHKTGEYTKCIETGGGAIDLSKSFEDQAKEACRIISSDKNYQNDFALVSISQGGVLAKLVIKKCEMKGTVKDLFL